MAGKAEEELSPRAKAWVIGVLVALGFAWLVWVSFIADDSSDSSSGEVMDLSAFNVCKDFVRDQLKSPGSAVFRNFFEDDGEVQVFASDPTYRVVSTVDSENSFGASLRTPFECTVTYRGDDRWTLTNMILGD